MRAILRGSSNGAFIHQLERLFQHGTAVGLTEGELLERFVRARDEAAFEALIARHGPMVMGVCRRLLRDPNDVDDAFQATFLVLVRRAGSLRRCDLLGNWLYGVAHRVAKRSQILAARRLARTPHGPDLVDQLDAGHLRRDGDDPSMHDLEPTPWLHEEVRRLPEKYRTVVLLCYFEGLTYEESAARLGCPVGTVKGRLARARDLLRKRLLRRGVGVSAAALEWHLALPDLHVAVPEPLKHATLQAALAIAGTSGGSMLTASVSLSVASLTDGVLRAMNPINLKAVSLVFLVAGAVTTGLVIASAQGPAQPDQPDDQGTPGGVTSEVRTEVIAQRKAERRNPAPAKRQPAGSPDASRKTETRIGGQPQAGGAGGMMRMMGGAMGGGQPGGGGFSGGMGGVGDDQESAGGGADESGEYERTLRLHIVELAAAMRVWDKTPENDAILSELDKPLKMPFAKPTPLEEVLKHIKSSKSEPDGTLYIPIYVDPKGLEDAGVKMDSKVMIDLEVAPLKTSLRLILKQLGLAYCVRDGVLIISSVEGIHEELAEAARELMGSGKSDQIDFRTLLRTGVIRRGMRGAGGMGGMGGPGGMGGGPGMM